MENETGVEKSAEEGVENRVENRFDPMQEMRLAIVMYGGISLAIYMNGVAQEILNLVRATAPEKGANGEPTDNLLWSEAKLRGGGHAYRRLGRMLTGGAPLRITHVPIGPVRTRFVVDIVTGTSAGGLNGVFLAKALGNSEGLDSLTDLWRKEGDVPRLLDDGLFTPASANQAGYPDALLNGRKIFDLLYEAITGMGFDGASSSYDPDDCASPYVEELDLFVTTTDVSGLMMPIKLQDEVIYERRYRNFYHFRYGYPATSGAPYNSFKPINHPFLAFACRCTSAFPFAFPAVDLGSAIRFARVEPSKEWEAFYADYVCASRAPVQQGIPGAEASSTQAPGVPRFRDDGLPFPKRQFIDGGCLDNKPFSYAIDALQWKQSDFPVQRKLLYLEPDPLDATTQFVSGEAPDAFGTVNAGYVDLPRAELIREDLQRLLERNRSIERIRDVIAVVQPIRPTGSTRQRTAQWRQQRLQDITAPHSPESQAYAAYHRTKVSAVTDFIANVLVCAAHLDPDSDDALAVRYLVKAWRDDMYADLTGSPDPNKPASSAMLLSYDFDYRIRRIGMVRRYLDVYHKHYAAQVIARGESAEDSRQRLQHLRDMKSAFNRIRRGLLRSKEWVATTDPEMRNPLADMLAAFDSGGRFAEVVRTILAPPTERGRVDAAGTLYLDPAYREGLSAIANRLAEVLAHGEENAVDKFRTEKTPPRLGFFEASDLAQELLGRFDVPSPGTIRNASGRTETIWTIPEYYYGYECYDAATFTTLAASGIGEPVQLEVVRLSPRDTRALPLPEGGAQKLAGTSLGHFGAFMDQCWRENDILWGRLDAAERLIKGLGPEVHPDDQTELIREAQTDILEEWCQAVGRQDKGAALYDAIRGKRLYTESGSAGGDWMLTPELFSAAALYGAKQGLPAISHDAAQQLGRRAVDTMADILSGVSANDRNTAPVRVTARLLARILAICGALLRAPLAASGFSGAAGVALAAVILWLAPRSIGIPLGVVLVLLAFVAPFWIYRKVETAIDRLLSVSTSEV